MTRDTIHLLSQYLPPHLLENMQPGGRITHETKAGYDPEVCRFAMAFSDMDFGWNFVRTMADWHLRFPGGILEGDDEVLFRAYMYRVNPEKYSTHDLRTAISLTSPAMTNKRIAIEGMLLAPGATYEKVASQTDHAFTCEAIATFEKLFFNVLDRRDDILYLQNIVYPHGRMVEMMEDYMQHASLGQLVRRAGYNNGAADVMFFMGASNSAIDALLQAASAKQLESMMMAFGVMLARNGGINQSSLPAITNARQLLTAGKLGGETNQDRALSLDFSEVLKREIAMHSRPAALMMEAN